MNCAELEEKLNAYADGEETDRAAVEAHLASCADCRRLLEVLRSQDRDLSSAFAPESARAVAAAERAIASIHRPRASWAPWLVAPLAAAAGFLLALLFLQKRESDPRIPALERRLDGALKEVRDLRDATDAALRRERGAKEELARQVTDLRQKAEGLGAKLADSEKQRDVIAKELADLKGKEPPRRPLAQLDVATGKVEVRKDGGEWEPLATGGAVEQGTWVRTLPKSKCSFQCEDGSEIRMNANTEIRFEKNRRIGLARGQIYTSVAPSKESDFQVKTEQATIEALGTVLDISHTERSAESHEKKVIEGGKITILTVVEGAARMAGQTVKSGYLCRVVDGKEQAPSRADDLLLMTKWVHELLTLKGKDSEELEKRVNELLVQIGRTKMERLYEDEIRAMGDHCALPLTRYIQSADSKKNQSQRRRAARILSDIASAPSVPDFVQLLTDADGEVRVWMARGLKRITGETLGYNDPYWQQDSGWGDGCRRWNSWLKEHESPWGAPKPHK